MNQSRLLAVIQRIENDLLHLSEVVAAVQKTLKTLSSEMRENGKKVETLQAGQRFLAGRFHLRDGTRPIPREMDDE